MSRRHQLRNLIGASHFWRGTSYCTGSSHSCLRDTGSRPYRDTGGIKTEPALQPQPIFGPAVMRFTRSIEVGQQTLRHQIAEHRMRSILRVPFPKPVQQAEILILNFLLASGRRRNTADAHDSPLRISEQRTHIAVARAMTRYEIDGRQAIYF